jgi:hypothetical protein
LNNELDFFQNGFSLTQVATGPLPFFVELELPVCMHAWLRFANACHDFALDVDLMVAHIDIALRIHQTDQMPLYNAAAGIVARQNIALLDIVKQHICCNLTIFRIAQRAKNALIVIVHRGSTLDLLRLNIALAQVNDTLRKWNLNSFFFEGIVNIDPDFTLDILQTKHLIAPEKD